MNLNSDEIQNDNPHYSEEERRAKAIEKITEMATLKIEEDKNTPRFLSGTFLNFFKVFLSIPVIGEFLTSILALIPMVLLGVILIIPVLLLIDYIAIEYFIYLLLFITIFVLIPISYWWLKLLEREVRLIVCLPIPIIELPVKYILYPLMFPFFGIRYIYQKLRVKSKTDNN